MQNGDDDDDFYMILPSNGCKDIHPDNEANKFITSWEQPISLDSRWKVALTEANFSYTMTSINTSFGIRYEKFVTTEIAFQGRIEGNVGKRVVNADFKELPFPAPQLSNLAPFKVPKVGFVEDSNDVFIEADYPFEIKILTENMQSHRHGAKPYIYRVITNLASLYDLPVEPGADMTFSVDMLLKYTTHPYKVPVEVFAKEDVFWSNEKKMAEGMLERFGDVFRNVSVVDKKLRVVPQAKLASIEFLNGLNIVLGFSKQWYDITKSPTMLNAENEPFLRHGINTMYVYSSVCQPIRIGGACVPFLKSIWMDSSKSRSHSFGEMRNLVVKNPMYLPLSSTSINTIEVNIRSNSGHLIPFVAGSITSLTLHLKRQRR